MWEWSAVCRYLCSLPGTPTSEPILKVAFRWACLWPLLNWETQENFWKFHGVVDMKIKTECLFVVSPCSAVADRWQLPGRNMPEYLAGLGALWLGSNVPLEAEGRRDSKVSFWWCKGGTRAIELARSDGKRNIYGPKKSTGSVCSLVPQSWLSWGSLEGFMSTWRSLQDPAALMSYGCIPLVCAVWTYSALGVTAQQRGKWAWWRSSVLTLCCDQSLLGCQWWDRALCLWLWSLMKLSILIEILKLLGNK